jgi:release factor H-coupled RctB family protein
MGKQVKAEVRVLASSKCWIEGSAVQQLEKTADLPGMTLAVGLPDLHPGKGSPIGAAFVTDDWIYPLLVGNDIGCGIGLWRTELAAQKPKLDVWEERLRKFEEPWDGDVAGWLGERAIELTIWDASLGSIGGGNHFAELQALSTIVSEPLCEQLGITKDAVYLCVHSGSRGFGEAILREHVAEYGLSGLRGADAEAYLTRHDHARAWAVANRELIAARILERLRTEGQRVADVCHNWVERVEPEGSVRWIHRKGAAPSTAGPVVIPGSRGAHSYLVMPKDPTMGSAYSLAHGAGRKWSRSECRGRLEKRFSVKDLARTELGSRVICEDRELLYEEAPQAYKDIDVVIESLVNEGLVEVIAILRPLVTYKVRTEK